METPTEKVEIRHGEFAGALSGWAKSAFRNARAFGLSPAASHGLGMAVMADIGRLMAENPECSISVAKAGKSGECKVKAIAKGSTRATRSLSLCRVMETVDGLYSEGLLAARKFPLLSETLSEYLEELEKKNQ